MTIPHSPAFCFAGQLDGVWIFERMRLWECGLIVERLTAMVRIFWANWHACQSGRRTSGHRIPFKGPRSLLEATLGPLMRSKLDKELERLRSPENGSARGEVVAFRRRMTWRGSGIERSRDTGGPGPGDHCRRGFRGAPEQPTAESRYRLRGAGQATRTRRSNGCQAG
jgi:hypothetical protein